MAGRGLDRSNKRYRRKGRAISERDTHHLKKRTLPTKEKAAELEKRDTRDSEKGREPEKFRENRKGTLKRDGIFRNNRIPQGLQIHVEPHIYKPDPLVLSAWDQAIHGFSVTLCEILIKHYSKVVTYEQELQKVMQTDMQRQIERSTISRQDGLYIQRLWKEETESAVLEAKKYSTEKAEQRKASQDNKRKRPRNEETPREENPLNLPGVVQKQLDDFRSEIRSLLPGPPNYQGRRWDYQPFQRGRGKRGRGQGRGRGQARDRGFNSGGNSGGGNTPRY